jgi:hypothetical protein
MDNDVIPTGHHAHIHWIVEHGETATPKKTTPIDLRLTSEVASESLSRPCVF